MINIAKKCLCKGLIIGMSVGVTVGFMTHLLTSTEKHCDIKKKITKAIKTAHTLIDNF